MLGRITIDLGTRLLLLIVAAMLCIAPFHAAIGQTIPLPGGGMTPVPPGGGGMTPVPPGGGGGGIKLLCTPPPDRCLTKEAREQWANEHNCQFPEDVCEKQRKLTPGKDSAGAQATDADFWGSLWNSVKGAVTYGYEFVKGVFAGLKSQIMDLWNLVTNPGEVIDGLVELGKSFFRDPKGTMKALGEALGQEAVDTFTRATQCGAYDLGNVIGSYVSPAFALKLASKLKMFSGKVADAAKVLRREYGCASFAGGTLVLTANGFAPIETIAVGQQVRSRNETSYADRPQRVTDVFGRIAPGYRRLVTETEEFKVTDEHPLWVQGKGWTEAHKLAEGDIIASEQGDTMVLANQAVKQPLRVYNFSVENTPNYFVGAGQIWAHNSTPCSIEIKTKNFSLLKPKEKGFRAEWEVSQELRKAGYRPVGNTPKFDGNPQADYQAWNGQTGIDAIYEKDGKYYIVESKAMGGQRSSNPDDAKLGLANLRNGDRQMSDRWIRERLEKTLPDPGGKVERERILDQLSKNKVTKIYAQRDPQGRSYNIVGEKDGKPVVTSTKWEP